MALTPKPQFAYPANGWWVVRDTNGALGLIKGNTPGADALSSVYVGAANNINDLASSLSTKLSDAIGGVGATAAQQTSLITEIDTAAGKNSNTGRILIGAKAAPGLDTASAADTSGKPVSTTPSGDATSAGINIGLPDVLSQIWAALTTPSNWLRALEIIGAAVAIFFGLKGLVEG